MTQSADDSGPELSQDPVLGPDAAVDTEDAGAEPYVDPDPDVLPGYDADAPAEDTEPASPQPAPEPVPAPPTRAATVRRSPRYRAFVLSGVLVGVLVAAVLLRLFPDDGRFSPGSVFGYLAVIGALLFGLVGALIAVVLDRPRR
jgi:hypothetical protein